MRPGQGPCAGDARDMSASTQTLSAASAEPTVAPPDDPLRAFLSGKRQGERHPCHVPATLEGVLPPVAVTLLDISESGSLVHIDEPAFVEAEQQGGTHAYLEMLQLHARDGLSLALPGGALRLAAEVVRWTAGEAGQGGSRIGLRFGRVLTPDEVLALRTGSPVARAENQEPVGGMPVVAEVLPWVPRANCALHALLFRSDRPEMGPLVVGRVLGAGPAAFALRVDGERTLLHVAGLLAGHALTAVLSEAGRSLWEGPAQVGWILPVAGTLAVDVGLSAPQRLPRRASRRFRAR